MADSHTAITCPHHVGCVLTLETCLKTELAERRPMTPEAWLDPWLERHRDRFIVAMVHTPMTYQPDKVLLIEAKDERDHTNLKASDAALEAGLDNLQHTMWAMDAQAANVAKRLDRLEQFVTRRKRWRKVWERDG